MKQIDQGSANPRMQCSVWDGSVRVMHSAEMPMTGEEYLHPDLTIPPNEWASIVCSVSAGGETGERWEASQDFHGRELITFRRVS